MKAIRLLGVLCVTAAGLIVTRSDGAPEIGLAAAAVLAALGLTLFVSRPRWKSAPQWRPAVAAPHAHAAPGRAWAG
ncbi:MAG TPA: hypothetical protein VGE76_24310 [Opitutaceae bacterium]